MAKVKREKGELRTMASQAKMRLKIGYWTQVKEERENAYKSAAADGINPQAVNDYYRTKVSRDIRSSEGKSHDDELYKKVCVMLDDNEDIINPIGRLIDNDKYSRMDSREKQRYIMMLAAKYQELSERYFNEKRGSWAAGDARK